MTVLPSIVSDVVGDRNNETKAHARNTCARAWTIPPPKSTRGRSPRRRVRSTPSGGCCKIPIAASFTESKRTSGDARSSMRASTLEKCLRIVGVSCAYDERLAGTTPAAAGVVPAERVVGAVSRNTDDPKDDRARHKPASTNTARTFLLSVNSDGNETSFCRVESNEPADAVSSTAAVGSRLSTRRGRRASSSRRWNRSRYCDQAATNAWRQSRKKTRRRRVRGR